MLRPFIGYSIIMIGAILVLSSCRKEKQCITPEAPDYSIFEGEWSVDETSIVKENDSTLYSYDDQYELIIMENSEGRGRLIKENYEADIQLAYYNLNDKVSIILVLPIIDNERTLSSDSYEINESSENRIHLQDLDHFLYANQEIRYSQTDLILTRK